MMRILLVEGDEIAEAKSFCNGVDVASARAHTASRQFGISHNAALSLGAAYFAPSSTVAPASGVD